MSRKLIKAPAPYSGYVMRSEDGSNYLITDQCVTYANISEEEIDQADAATFGIEVQTAIDNASANYSQIVNEETIEAVTLEIQTAIENFE